MESTCNAWIAWALRVPHLGLCAAACKLSPPPARCSSSPAFHSHSACLKYTGLMKSGWRYDSSDSDFEDGPSGKHCGNGSGVAAGPRRQQQQQPPRQQQQQQQQQPAVAAARQQRQLPPPASSVGVGKKVRPVQQTKPPPQQQVLGRRMPSADSSSSSKDEFVAGTLKQVPVPVQQPKPPPKLPAARGPTSSKAVATAAGGAADGSGFGARAEVIRLDTLAFKQWPGWQAAADGVRRVAPYQPPTAAAAAAGDSGSGNCGTMAPPPAADSGSRLELVADLRSYDLACLGGGFQGVLLNVGPAALDSLVAGGWRLGKGLMSSGLLFVWADKSRVAQGVRLMAANGFRYVENLTWVQLGPNAQPLQVRDRVWRYRATALHLGVHLGCSAYAGHACAPPTLPYPLPTFLCCHPPLHRPQRKQQGLAPLFCRSHATLLIGRRGTDSQHLELRHQRTPDVIVSPALPDGCCPEAVFSMIQTLLPDATGAKAGERLRLLELVCSADSGGGSQLERRRRPGWLTLVQQS